MNDDENDYDRIAKELLLINQNLLEGWKQGGGLQGHVSVPHINFLCSLKQVSNLEGWVFGLANAHRRAENNDGIIDA